jgi:hypothetical protein
MKLSQDTITILKNFSTINQSIIFKPGNVIRTISPQKTVMASATVPDEFPREAGIYNLSRFLSTLSMYSEADLTFEDKRVLFKQGKSMSYLTYTDASMIVAPPQKQIDLPGVDVSVKMSAENLQNVLKATGILGLPEVAFVGQDGSCYLKAIDSSNPSADSHSIDVGETEDTFSLIIKTENLQILPGDYTVELSSKGISKFTGKQATYFVAIESKSTYKKG